MKALTAATSWALVLLPDDSRITFAVGKRRGDLGCGGRGGDDSRVHERVPQSCIGQRLFGDFSDGSGLGVTDEHALGVGEVGDAVDVRGVRSGNGEHGDVLDQILARGDGALHGLELFLRSGDEEVALVRRGDLRLDLRSVGVGHVHLAAGLLSEQVRDFLEGLGHARATVDV